MEGLEQLLEAYGRCLLLEDQVPQLDKAREETRREALAAERNLSMKRTEWECLKEPGLFRRILGRVEEKREAAYREYQKAEKACRLAKRKAADARAAYETAGEELDQLKELPDRYMQAKESGEFPDLAEGARKHFRPAALDAAERCLMALENARAIAREQVAAAANEREIRKQGYFSEAETAAKRLLWLLEQIPEGERWRVDYLSNPGGFLLLATKYGRMDRLNSAIAQVQNARNWLRKE